MSGTSLIVFHIGPVQEFILTARRSRDLWFGSWMLSELAKAAAREVVRISGGDTKSLVFPSPEHFEGLESEQYNVPNKIVAFVKDKPESVATSIRQAIDRRLHEFRDDSYSRVRGTIDRETAWKQIDDMLEFYWAAVPCSGTQEYPRARRLVEGVLAARKLTREFAPVTWGSNRPKCSLDGVRESVIPNTVIQQRPNSESLEESLQSEYGVRFGEHLCGVCLLKRHGRGKERTLVLSTSHLAAIPLLKTLQRSDKPRVQEYLGELRALGVSQAELDTVRPEHPVFGGCDGEILFEERLAEFLPAKERLPQAKAALRRLLDETFGRARPSPYYALLCADGDNVGKAIDSLTTPEDHRELSGRQSRFAQDAMQIVQEHDGSLLYAGGDDVLALLPLSSVLECAGLLSKSFRTLLEDFRVQGEDGISTASPTLSVGVVIAHHLIPMSDVMGLAREALKTAKSVRGKNALAVTLSKRSGANRTVKGRWGEVDRRLARLVELHLDDAIPDRVAYQLTDLVLSLRGLGYGSDTVTRLLMHEVKRILGRKRQKHGREMMSTDTLTDLISMVGSALTECEEPTQGIEQIVGELIVAREMSRVAKVVKQALQEVAP